MYQPISQQTEADEHSMKCPNCRRSYTVPWANGSVPAENSRWQCLRCKSYFRVMSIQRTVKIRLQTERRLGDSA